jgi:hypothetical protein
MAAGRYSDVDALCGDRPPDRFGLKAARLEQSSITEYIAKTGSRLEGLGV